MKSKLLIIGASGHGKVVADIAMKIERWNTIYFLDDNPEVTSAMGIKVVGRSAEAINYREKCDIFVGIGNNAIRQKNQEELERAGATIPTLVHPNAVIGEQVSIGNGTVVMAGVVINCCTRIGKGCVINTGTTVDHDSLIEDYVHLSPGVHLAGTVRVGEGSWLGIGSIVSNNINITDHCVVGAGAVVIKDLIEPGTYVGVPVRKYDR